MTTPTNSPKAPDSLSNKNLLLTCLTELLGTFLLVSIGTGTAVIASLGTAIAGRPIGSFEVALAFGVTLFLLAASLGPISGGHFNPAVTLAMLFIGRFPLRFVAPYMIVQCIGAVLASLTVAYLIPGSQSTSLGLNTPAAGLTALQVILWEGGMTTLLILVILAVTDKDRADNALAPLAIGLALFIAVLVAGPFTGGAINPARALGPMVVTGSYGHTVLYLLSTLVIGGVFGPLIYGTIETGKPPTAADSSKPPVVTVPPTGQPTRHSTTPSRSASRRRPGVVPTQTSQPPTK